MVMGPQKARLPSRRSEQMALRSHVSSMFFLRKIIGRIEKVHQNLSLAHDLLVWQNMLFLLAEWMRVYGLKHTKSDYARECLSPAPIFGEC
jgi:hypothetical protein